MIMISRNVKHTFVQSKYSYLVSYQKSIAIGLLFQEIN